MEKSIRVRVLGRDYALRVNEDDEAVTREIASYVDTKMRAFHRAFPDQPELTTAVIAALAIAEEYFSEREQRERQVDSIDEELVQLEQRLIEALEGDESETESSSGYS